MKVNVSGSLTADYDGSAVVVYQILNGNKPYRPFVIKEVEKFRGCGDRKKGFKPFLCERLQMFGKFLIDVKADVVRSVQWEKAKNGVRF
ncbi:hypothetical protein LIT25_12295 [Bacillus sp. F19]|nr:hypothetical protein LIT25_12295 [Bacillus sp. F19]